MTGVRTSRGDRSAAHVVICTGCWAGELGEWLPRDVAAFRPPIEPVRGQILALDSPPRRLRSIVWGDEAYIVPKRDGSVVVGATEERVGFDCRLPGVGAVPGVRGLSVAIGHARNGVLLAPLTGRIVADAILGKQPKQAAALLDPARWC